jgi:2-keto-4-pentenoate hydratase/2-oxohepta-3-ene-1,7-dioic acid hydratase in catechol pathway
MRWLRFEHNGKTVYGVASGDTIEVTDATWCDILAGKTGTVTDSVDRGSVDLLSPMDRPGKIVAIGLNYLDHCRETNTPPPDRPVIFTKFTTSIVGPGDEIVWSPQLTAEVDFEAELAAVIGKTARHVSRDDALDYVAGYTCSNDVSARDLQLGDPQWIRGKSLDTFCPIGPAFVTADEVPDPQVLDIRCLLNGEVMQESNTREMIFGVAELIEFSSNAFTLEPGDVILTGTPHGVGMGRDPKVWMKDGDTVVIEIEKLGRLENTCRMV